MRWRSRCNRNVQWVPPPVLNVRERTQGFLEIQKCRGGFVSTTWKVVHTQPRTPHCLGDPLSTTIFLASSYSSTLASEGLGAEEL